VQHEISGNPVMSLDLHRFMPKHRILIDTCTLMDQTGRAWVEFVLWPELKRFGRRLVVPERVDAELANLCSASEATRAASAKGGRRLVKEMRAGGCADIFGDAGDPFADAVIASTVTRNRTKFDILVITQDSGLAQLLTQVRDSDAITSRHDLTVARIGSAGLEAWFAPRGTRAKTTTSGSRKGIVATGFGPNSGTATQTQAIFPRPSGKVAPSKGRVTVTFIPKAGDQVQTEAGIAVTLGKEIASGGEGTVYLAGQDKVAKIYKADRLSVLTLDKLKLMTANPVQVEGVCWPESLLYNRKLEPVGYLMPQAAGFSLDTSVFKKPLLLKKLPNWRRIDLVRLAIRVAEIVDGLHRHNVILGDINPNNILVMPEGRVTFVDLDSAQVADNPCPVGMVNFTRPQHHGKNFDSYLRDFDDDRFALAVMLFMILVPGKPPYSHAGGGEPGENIRKKNFPYPVGDKSASGMPDGPWRFIWSHLSRRLKEAFSKAFTEDNLHSPAQWIEVLRMYGQAIEKGFMDSEQGNDIFPNRGKRLSAEVQNRFNIQQEEMVGFSCQSCGKAFEIRRTKLERYTNPPKRCSDCRKAVKLQEQLSSNAPGSGTPSTTRYAGQGNSRPARPTPPALPMSPRYSSRPTVTQPYGGPSVGGLLLSLLRKLRG
jgi:serine/threonine protein kinase/rRNA-processing protein FCF1